MRLINKLLLLFALILSSCEMDGEADVIPPETTTDEACVLVLNANPWDSSVDYEQVSGVAADGVSQLEFAIAYDGDNKVTGVSVTQLNGEAWGTLDTELSTPTFKNRLYAYRFTLTASETLPEGLSSSSSVDLTYQFDVTTADGETNSYECVVSVVRPPALFVHGLASNAATYDTMLGYIKEKGLYLDEALYAVDYASTSIDSYETNKDVVPDAIVELRSAMAAKGIVSDRVSVVGHSMGGILTRMYMQGRSSVGYRDDIHKLICIDTPHSGSQLADFAIEYAQTHDDGLVALFASMGAVVDLAVASDATAELNSTENLAMENGLEIPTHLITAHIGTLTDVAALVKDDKVFGGVLTLAINVIEQGLFYNGDTSDIVVPTQSQEGGVESGLLSKYISEYSNLWHCSVLISEDVSSDLVTLLDAESSSKYFTTDGFAPPLLSFDPSIIDSL